MLLGIPTGAFTATATEHVRRDIAEQLYLHVLVGNIDLPNLVHRVGRRINIQKQMDDALARHRGQAGMIYCISRAHVDQLCGELGKRGYRVGVTDEERCKSRKTLIGDQPDLIVAGLAFGMAIEEPDLRLVIHAGMPDSLEHNQRERSRPDRDGLDARLYSGADWALPIKR